MVDLYCLAQTVVDALKMSNLSISTAESLTGGLIAATLIDVPGASDVVRGGFVTYQTEMKTALLDIAPEIIDKFNVVSSRVAIEMAQKAREKSGADIAVSATGLAGPGGGTDEIPVGTVYVGIATPNYAYALPLHLNGERYEIRRTTVARALQFLLREALNIYGSREEIFDEEMEEGSNVGNEQGEISGNLP